MEVVGAVSSIITVIQITATVVSICYDYQSGTRHYHKDVVKITHELQSLRNVLESLADLASSWDKSTSTSFPALDMLNGPGGPLETCKVELKQLEVKLVPTRGRLRQFGRAIAWPLKEKDVRKTLDTLARQRGLCQLALTVDQTTMTMAIKDVTSRNEENMMILNQRFRAMALEQRDEQIIQWLAAPDPSSNHNKACQKKHHETGRWLLESPKYIHWKNQQTSFLWLHGIPGCGKTVLCSAIVKDIASTCQAGGCGILAYYYFDFNENKKQTYQGLVRSLVSQLFTRSPKSSRTIETLFMECGEGQREPTSRSLVQALRDLSQQFQEVFLILDALDECVEVPAVISLLEEIRDWHDKRPHILVTSRKEAVIDRGLRGLVTDQIHVQNDLVDADIRLLVRECLRDDPELSRWSGNIKDEVQSTLCEGSKGMFRWVVCQLDTLRRCVKPSALRKALASLPKTLDDTYERILSNIHQEHAEDVLKVLQWLAFSARPLELHEVAEATAITLDGSPTFDPEERLRHPTDIITICSSLISVSTRPIKFSFEEPSSYKRCHPQSAAPEQMFKSGSLDGHTEELTTLPLKEPSEYSAAPTYFATGPLSVDDSSCNDSLLESESSDGRSSPVATFRRQEQPCHYEVRLAHDSVKEYLISERIKNSKAAFYSISEASTNVFLARSCIAYLMHFKEPLSDSTAEYLSDFPLLRYSAQEWEFHVSRSKDLACGTLLNSVLRDFFLTQNYSFTNWLIVPFAPYYGNHQQMELRSSDTGDIGLEWRLFHASRLGLVDICQLLLEQGASADPPTRSTTGLVKSLSTPLQIAAYKGNEAVVRLLLDRGADVNQSSIHSSTLDYAIAEGWEPVVRLLLERGAGVTIEAASPYYGLKGLASLILAARAGHVGITKLVLDNGTYPRPRTSYSEAYREAIAQGHQSVADLLLAYGADPNYFTGIDNSDYSYWEYFNVKT